MWCQCMTEGVRSPRPDDWLKNPILLNLGALAASREECRPVGMVTAPARIVCISGRSRVTDVFPTIQAPHHIAPPLINCLLKLLPPSLWSAVQVRQVTPPAAAGESWEYKNQQWGPARPAPAHEPLLHSLPNTPAIKIPTPNADLAPN